MHTTGHHGPRGRGGERAARRGPAVAARGFTLIELLAAIGIVAIITGITVVAFAVIAKDAKLSLAHNAITATLDNARNLAIRDREMVMVVFRPRVRNGKQYVELLTTRWSGETYRNLDYNLQHDRFVPIPDVPVREITPGIAVAGPYYAEDQDQLWLTQADLRKSGAEGSLPAGWTEAVGVILGVMYASDGTVVTRNPARDTDTAFVDFNQDALQQWRKQNSNDLAEYDNLTAWPPHYPFDAISFMQSREDDERNIMLVPYLAVFDREEAEEHCAGNWAQTGPYQLEMLGPTGFINSYADRLHFNRFTGVILR